MIRRDIQDNVDYRERKRELADQKTEMQDVEEKLSEIQSTGTGEEGVDVHQALGQAQQHMSAQREKRAGLKGQGATISQQIREQKIKLKDDKYRNIDKRHRKKMIEYETTSL